MNEQSTGLTEIEAETGVISHFAWEDFRGDECQKGTPLVTVCPECGGRDVVFKVDGHTWGVCTVHHTRWMCGRTPTDCHTDINTAQLMSFPSIAPHGAAERDCVEAVRKVDRETGLTDGD